MRQKIPFFSDALKEGGGNTLFAINYASANQEMTKMSKKEIKARLPEWRKNYDNTPVENSQLKLSRGMHLGVAYMRVGQRKNAKQVFNELVNNYIHDKKTKKRLQRAIKKIVALAALLELRAPCVAMALCFKKVNLKSRAQPVVGHGFCVGRIYHSSQEKTRQSTFSLSTIYLSLTLGYR